MNSRRPRLRPVVVAALALGAMVLTAAPASAHAVLESTEPVGGTAVATSPERVLLRFSEAVQIPPKAIRVFASPSGEQMDTGAAGRADGQSNAVAVKLPELDRGSYIVTWRVTSADAHPIHGAFTFVVGEAKGAEADAALVQKLLSSGGGDTTVGAVYAVIRFAAFASLVLLVGGFAFVALLWPAGVAVGRTRRVLWGAWAVALVTTAVGIPVQALYVAGLPISNVLSSSVRSAMLDDRFGQVWSARLVLLGLTAALLAFLFRRIPANERQMVSRRALLAGGGLLAVGLLLTPGLAGHAATQDLVPLAIASDVLHVGAVSIWLGGLALLVVAMLPRQVADELAVVVPRFSRVAFGAVVTILVTGTFQGWRQVRSTAALTETTYGRLLIIKVVLFAVIVALGALSRRFVQARYRLPAARLSFGPGTATADPDSEIVAGLRRTVGAETVIAVVVLAVTSLLVNAQPARSALAQPFSASMRTDLVLVDVTVDPAKTGPADFHLYTLSPQGGQQDVQDLTVTLTLPSQDVGPLKVPLTRAGPGHFSAYDFALPLKGDWKLEVKALLSDIDEATVSTTIPVK